MEICEQGFLNLANGIVEQLGMDYKFLWYLKVNYDAGDWFIYGSDPTSRQREKCNDKYVVMGGLPPMEKSETGKMHYIAITIDQALDEIEEYLEYHPIVGDKKAWIIKKLRNECNDMHTKKRVRKALKRIGMLPKASNM